MHEIETIIDQFLALQVATSMKDLCFDVFGISSEKKDPRDAKGNRGMCLSCFIFSIFSHFVSLAYAFCTLTIGLQTC